MSDSDRSEIRMSDAGAALRELREEIRKTCHDIQNPVAIISGNAEILAEAAAALGLSDDIRLPIVDIAEANDLLAERIERLRLLVEEAERAR